MELRPDDELSLAGKQHKRATSSLSMGGSFLAAVFDDDSLSPSHRRRNTDDFIFQDDIAFWDACRKDPGLNHSGKKIRKPPGF